MTTEPLIARSVSTRGSSAWPPSGRRTGPLRSDTFPRARHAEKQRAPKATVQNLSRIVEAISRSARERRAMASDTEEKLRGGGKSVSRPTRKPRRTGRRELLCRRSFWHQGPCTVVDTWRRRSSSTVRPCTAASARAKIWIISHICVHSSVCSRAGPDSCFERLGKEPQMPIEMMIRKLRQHSDLSNEDVEALRSIVAPARNFPEDSPIFREGDLSTRCCVILSGFAYRSKVSEEGKRQILSFHIAGDMPDLHSCHRSGWTMI